MGMTLNSTDVNLDDILDMLAYIIAKENTPSETVKDSLALVLEHDTPFNVDELYNQAVERAEVLEGAV